jgi:YebC/PmpR family DNA-binding regulatory protein
MASAIKKGGSDPDSNAALRLVIEKAKSVNMPKDNIKRALDKATKEKDSADLIELTYEGYGPGGVAIVVECLTDNNNRTSANIKANFNKRGGNLGATGSVSYLFKSKGQIVFESDKTEDE